MAGSKAWRVAGSEWPSGEVAMFGIGAQELLIVGVIAVILFGNRLPSVARSLGKSLNEFKRGMRDFENEMHSTIYSDPPKSVTYDEKTEHHTPPADPTASDATSSSEAAAPPSGETSENEPPGPSAT